MFFFILGCTVPLAHSPAQISAPQSCEELVMFLCPGIYSLQMQKETPLSDVCSQLTSDIPS